MKTWLEFPRWPRDLGTLKTWIPFPPFPSFSLLLLYIVRTLKRRYGLSLNYGNFPSSASITKYNPTIKYIHSVISPPAIIKFKCHRHITIFFKTIQSKHQRTYTTFFKNPARTQYTCPSFSTSYSSPCRRNQSKHQRTYTTFFKNPARTQYTYPFFSTSYSLPCRRNTFLLLRNITRTQYTHRLPFVIKQKAIIHTPFSPKIHSVFHPSPPHPSIVRPGNSPRKSTHKTQLVHCRSFPTENNNK